MGTEKYVIIYMLINQHIQRNIIWPRFRPFCVLRPHSQIRFSRRKCATLGHKKAGILDSKWRQ